MDIHITRKGEKHGPYPEATARQFLEEGKLLPTDLAWHAGADGWKPLSEVLGAATQPPATPPPAPQPPGGGIPKRTMAGAAPAEEKPAEEKPEDSEPDDPDKISVTRKGEPIGPYSREKAKEYFASGQLLPTDWGWHDGMDDWKPLNEVLGMAASAQTAAAVGKSGKGKKVAMIAGIVVLLSGLVFAGITYGPDLVAKAPVEAPAISLEDAIFEEDLAAVKQHIAAKTNLDTPRTTPDDGNTPIHTAVFVCNIEIVTALVEAGVNVNAKNKRGDTPLVITVAPFETVKPVYLLISGLTQKQFDFPRIERDRVKVAAILRKAGAN
jgi:hypothetical protein